MCKERWRTRDLLLKYNTYIMPPTPHAANLKRIYDWDLKKNNQKNDALSSNSIDTDYTSEEIS